MGCSKSDCDEKSFGCLCPVGFGVAFGVACALFMLVYGWLAWFGIGDEFIGRYNELSYGYGPSFWGGIIGAAWGFVKGFIFGFVVVFVYNLLMRCCHSKCSSDKE